jgi:exodeoxyribonuclease VII small subunit
MKTNPKPQPQRRAFEKFMELERLPFEQALLELEQIVRDLENDQVPLEQMIHLFERANLLAQHCSNILENAKTRIDTVNQGESNSA